MPSKKNKEVKNSKEIKPNAAFLSGIKQKKLLTAPQDRVLCDIASAFEDQFHYLLFVKGNELEIFYSPSVKKITGYQPSELIKKDSLGREFVHQEDISDVKKRLHKIENGKISSLKLLFRFVRKDGKIIWLKEQIKSEAMNDGIILKGLVADVTEFKKAENDYGEIINNLSEEITARDNFLSILSHDLRAPF
ncbi:MAG: PAS domain-containing protein, partial [Ignavibacteriaceae bacterium]|nr:PAS domain-containing protein [Ignavibacteriaceae bacterium]